MKRKRKYISYPERLAAALALLLPPGIEVDLRGRRAPARTVIRMFTNDHIVLHALSGSDKWWNLHVKLRSPAVLAKNANDTHIVAKTRRISAAHRDFVRRVLGPVKRKKRHASRWPKRKFRSG